MGISACLLGLAYGGLVFIGGVGRGVGRCCLERLDDVIDNVMLDEVET